MKLSTATHREQPFVEIDDINSKRMLIKIKGAKGRKNLHDPLANKLFTYLEEYYKNERLKVFLFKENPGEDHDATSIYSDIKDPAKKTEIRKEVYLRILRHSFANHNLEQGMDLRFIQKISGHEIPITKENYTHISQKGLHRFKNSFDDAFCDDG